MGVFDWPAPLFGWLDSVLGAIASPTLRLIFWGLVGAVISMGLYWLFSNQKRLTEIKTKATAARRDLNAHDGEFEEAWPLMKRMLGLSFRQLGLTTWPAIAASIPVLALIVYLGGAYGYHLPPALDDVGLRISPEATGSASLEPGATADDPALLRVTDDSGTTIDEIAMTPAIPIVHKRQWWNALFGNPLGYLPSEGAIDAVEIDLPETEYLSFGPGWLRPWYIIFFATLVAGSLAIKILGRIE